ncbi:hypothetical protein [Halocynthiibacter styelae]|uniref:Uncharacterized protein n=1 Tax=Halocynthiibacter styelae TaxID=2761955 RepID=A0A8J7LWC6_9RHOB|nr:hypothetical protein [Paenihalocynthiibacter styelae]MBI1494182.1 hypothetical protein [Paenihalocynthiibacter styelae]
MATLQNVTGARWFRLWLWIGIPLAICWMLGYAALAAMAKAMTSGGVSPGLSPDAHRMIWAGAGALFIYTGAVFYALSLLRLSILYSLIVLGCILLIATLPVYLDKRAFEREARLMPAHNVFGEKTTIRGKNILVISEGRYFCYSVCAEIYLSEDQKGLYALLPEDVAALDLRQPVDLASLNLQHVISPRPNIYEPQAISAPVVIDLVIFMRFPTDQLNPEALGLDPGAVVPPSSVHSMIVSVRDPQNWLPEREEIHLRMQYAQRSVLMYPFFPFLSNHRWGVTDELTDHWDSPAKWLGL